LKNEPVFNVPNGTYKALDKIIVEKSEKFVPELMTIKQPDSRKRTIQIIILIVSCFISLLVVLKYIHAFCKWLKNRKKRRYLYYHIFGKLGFFI